MASPRGPSVADDALVILMGSKPLTSAATAMVMLPPTWGWAPPLGAGVEVAVTLRSAGCVFGVALKAVVLVDFFAVVLLVTAAVVLVAPPTAVVVSPGAVATDVVVSSLGVLVVD